MSRNSNRRPLLPASQASQSPNEPAKAKNQRPLLLAKPASSIAAGARLDAFNYEAGKTTTYGAAGFWSLMRSHGPVRPGPRGGGQSNTAFRPSSGSLLLQLPVEILTCILDLTSDAAILSLAATCKDMQDFAHYGCILAAHVGVGGTGGTRIRNLAIARQRAFEGRALDPILRPNEGRIRELLSSVRPRDILAHVQQEGEWSGVWITPRMLAKVRAWAVKRAASHAYRGEFDMANAYMADAAMMGRNGQLSELDVETYQKVLDACVDRLKQLRPEDADFVANFTSAVEIIDDFARKFSVDSPMSVKFLVGVKKGLTERAEWLARNPFGFTDTFGDEGGGSRFIAALKGIGGIVATGAIEPLNQGDFRKFQEALIDGACNVRGRDLVSLQSRVNLAFDMAECGGFQAPRRIYSRLADSCALEVKEYRKGGEPCYQEEVPRLLAWETHFRDCERNNATVVDRGLGLVESSFRHLQFEVSYSLRQALFPTGR
jgi:hypothetical protein